MTVRDIDASARWYGQLFELEELRREESEHRRAVVLGVAESPVQIGLVQHAGTGSQSFDPTVIGLDHAAWSVETREELDDWERLFAARGIQHSPIADVGPVAILNFKDPDGIALALFWDAPRT